MDKTPKLQFVRVYLGEQRMDVGLHDPTLDDPRRLVRYEWHEKDATDTPPEDWYATVLGEVQYQRGQELKAATGRLVPRG